MTEGLDPVAKPADLYLARGPEVDPYRPILQGDIFRRVKIPGVDDDGDNLAMVIAHPCSMRRGAQLKPFVTVIQVRPFVIPKPQTWATGHFGLMPLEELRPEEPARIYAAYFELVGRVASSLLPLFDRIACLSEQGISILQQRQVHFLTRAKIERQKLAEVSQPILEEADLQEEWNRRICEHCPQERLEKNLAAEAEAFDKLLSAQIKHDDGSEGPSLRESLQEVDRRATVRRAVHAAIKQRIAEGSDRPSKSSGESGDAHE